jgi:carbamoylphosphate synthase small subunit
MIDTLRLSKRLREAGMEQGVAEAMADALNEEMKESSVSKADLTQAVTELKHNTLQTCLAVCGTVGVAQIGVIYALIMRLVGHS